MSEIISAIHRFKLSGSRRTKPKKKRKWNWNDEIVYTEINKLFVVAVLGHFMLNDDIKL